MRLTRNIFTLRLLLYCGIFLIFNLLAYRLFFRLDFSADRRYTLSASTRQLLRQLDEPVTVTAYVSETLPPELDALRSDLNDLLEEYRSEAGGKFAFEMIAPASEELEQEAMQEGIVPLDIQSREKDQIKVLRGYMGAVVRRGSGQESIPQFVSGAGMEYLLSSAIRKLSAGEKPRVGFVQGHGEPGLASLSQAVEELSVLYEADTLRLRSLEAMLPFKTLVILAPRAPFAPQELALLDQYLGVGGRLFLGLNAVDGSLQAQGPWLELKTGLESWLPRYGLGIEPLLVSDVECATVNFQRRQGFFVVSQPLPFYYIPAIRQFEPHPITTGLDEVLLPFASPLRLSPPDSVRAQVLAQSSGQSGREAPPLMFDPERVWTEADFPEAYQPLVVALEGRLAGPAQARLVLAGDGDFAVAAEGQGVLPDNVNLLVNAIDWLSDDTGLIELRTRRVETRPIQAQLSDSGRSLVKWANFLLPILGVMALGVQVSRRRRLRQLAWQQEESDSPTDEKA